MIPGGKVARTYGFAEILFNVAPERASLQRLTPRAEAFIRRFARGRR